MALNEAIAQRSRRYGSARLVELLNAAGVPCGPINAMNEVFEDPQVRHLGMAVPVPRAGGGSIDLVAPAIRLSRTPAQMRRAIGAAGEHNDEVLGALGYSTDEIAQLRAAQVI